MDIGHIEKAAERLRGVVHETPLEYSSAFSELYRCSMYLKYENQQKTGSFKVRGAFNKLAALAGRDGRPDMAVTSSAGNHAQGVAYAAARFGVRSTVVMPETAPLAKISATRGYGAQVVLHGHGYDDAFERAQALQRETGAAFIPAFDDEDVIAGQGTVGLELLRALPTVDVVLVPCGGGGLLAGVAACIKQVNPRITIIGVQAEGADAVYRSFHGRQWVAGESVSTIADGIAVKSPGKRTVELILQYADDVVTIGDAEIAGTILLLLERCKQVVEPAGAAALAAAGKLPLLNRRVACILSGGNIDVSLLGRIVERGLVERGRRMQLHTVLSDVPGSLQAFCDVVTRCGANILMIQHDRLSEGLRLNETYLHLTCELDGEEHGARVVASLEGAGYRVVLD